MLATKEKSHPGFQLPIAALHPGFGFAISNTATSFHTSVYDFCSGPLSSGYFRDQETGLDYADQRYHQPGMGRFLTPDPFMGSAGLANPESWNRYAYVAGDPVNRTDRKGLYVDCTDDGDCDESDGGYDDGGGGGGDDGYDTNEAPIGYDANGDPIFAAEGTTPNSGPSLDGLPSGLPGLSMGGLLDLLGLDPANPLPSCFGLFITQTGSNMVDAINPATPSFESAAAAAAYYLSRIQAFNSTLAYVANVSASVGWSNMMKSSIVRNGLGIGKWTLANGWKNAKIVAARTAMVAYIDAAMLNAFLFTEYPAMKSGQCQ